MVAIITLADAAGSALATRCLPPARARRSPWPQLVRVVAGIALTWPAALIPSTIALRSRRACRICFLRGADHLLQCLEKRLGMHDGQTTPDGSYTLTAWNVWPLVARLR